MTRKSWGAWLAVTVFLAYVGLYFVARAAVHRSWYTTTSYRNRDGSLSWCHVDLVCECFVFIGWGKPVGVIYYPFFWIDGKLNAVPILWVGAPPPDPSVKPTP